MPGKRTHLGWLGLPAGVFMVVALLLSGYWWLKSNLSEPREAPEAERVVSAQAGLPFQVLIPAYLPAGFDRKRVEIQTGRLGPQGEDMVRLIYSDWRGAKLILDEWIPLDSEAANPGGKPPDGMAAGVRPCNCICQDHSVGSITRLMIQVDMVHVMGETSDPQLLSRQQVETILRTLGPALGVQIHSSLKEIPPARPLPPAVQVSVNAEGIQEIVLVVTPSDYAPAHFAVKQNVPVRLIFRQLGQVGCGNELVVHLSFSVGQWSVSYGSSAVPGQPGKLTQPELCRSRIAWAGGLPICV
jgi:hypothetical protein